MRTRLGSAFELFMLTVLTLLFFVMLGVFVYQLVRFL